MNEQVHLAVDIGAESGRVIAGLWNGKTLQLEEVHRFPNGTVHFHGALRWDLPRLWAAIEEGLRLAGRRFPSGIVSVGVDTWALDYALLSASGELLGHPFCYRDPRTRGMVEELCRRVPRREIFHASGLQFMEINTLCQWAAHHRQSPEILDAARQFLMIPDFLHHLLSGSTVAEFTNATTTQFFHPTQRRWSTPLLHQLGLPSHPLPGIVEPGTLLGPLRPDVAVRTGLGPIQVIAPATHDTASAVAAIPTTQTGQMNWAYISSGTWSLVGIEAPEPILTDDALRLNITNEGGTDGRWRVLKNVMGLWLVQQCRKSFELAGRPADYAELARLAAEAPPLRSVFDPDAPCFLNPSDMAATLREECARLGEPIPKTEGEIIRAALDSLALKYAAVLDQLEKLGGERIEVVHVVGGGARNQLLNQLTAHATQRRVLAGPVEATAIGNILVQMRCRGELASLDELRRLSGSLEPLVAYEPDPRQAPAWRAARTRVFPDS